MRGTLCDSNEMESRWIESTWMVDVVVELILFESKTGKGNVGVGVCCCLSREMRGENVTKVSGIIRGKSGRCPRHQKQFKF